jgi:phytol kinase
VQGPECQRREPIETELFAFFPPDTGTVLVTAPLAWFTALFAGRVASAFRRRGMAASGTRKVFHVAIFTCAAAVHVWRGAAGVVTFGTVIALVVLHSAMRGEGHPLFDALSRPAEAPRARWSVLTPLVSTAVGGVVSNLLFGSIAVVGYLVAGWGDALAEPVGTRWGRHRYRVPSMADLPATRSLEGSAAMLVAGGIGAFVALVASGVPGGPAGAAAIAAGLAGGLVEAVSPHGLDNLTVQVAASGMASFVLSAAYAVAMS